LAEKGVLRVAVVVKNDSTKGLRVLDFEVGITPLVLGIGDT
jgi:hypothetical protein